MTQNFAAFHANQAYRSASVAVSPLKAMVLLHDGAITFLQKAVDAHEARRFEEGHGHLVRATSILRGLSHNLNFDRGGEMAERLYKAYSSLILACLRIYGKPKAREGVRKISASLAELRDAWVFVDATVNGAKKPVSGAGR